MVVEQRVGKPHFVSYLNAIAVLTIPITLIFSVPFILMECQKTLNSVWILNQIQTYQMGNGGNQRKPVSTGMSLSFHPRNDGHERKS